jgi:hypothetical protein
MARERRRYSFPETPPRVTTTTAKVYRFTWPGSYSGWAVFTVCDDTGEFSIQSDWGNFSYRWNIRALGNEGKTTLHEFLAERSPGNFEYIVNKLSYENHALKDVFDKEATEAEFKREIIKLRRSWEWDKEKARAYWEMVEEMCEDAVSEGFEWVYHSDRHNELFGEFECAYEYMRTCKPTLWYIVQDELLPRFAEYVREHVLAKSEPAVQQP